MTPERRTTTLARVRSRFIAPDLLSDDASPCLLGGRRRGTQRIVFPCPNGDPEFEPVRLPRQGRLWSFTVQRFPPKSPPYRGDAHFTPFAVGYIEIEANIILESRLVNAPFDELRIGLPMELTTFVLRTDADGEAVRTFAFQPIHRTTS